MSLKWISHEADTLAVRMRADMLITLTANGVRCATFEALLDELVNDGMMPVEHLLIENDTLHGVIADV